MTTKKQLIEALQAMTDYSDDCEVVIYPKYSYGKVDGFKKHSFLKENVSRMETHGFGQIHKYIAIVF